MKLKKIPLIIYSLAVILLILVIVTVNITGNYFNDTESILFKNIILLIILAGAIIGLINNIKIKDKQKRNIHIIFISGLVFCILSNLTYYISFLGDMLYWIEIVTAFLGYSLIILFIIFIVMPKKK